MQANLLSSAPTDTLHDNALIGVAAAHHATRLKRRTCGAGRSTSAEVGSPEPGSHHTSQFRAHARQLIAALSDRCPRLHQTRQKPGRLDPLELPQVSAGQHRMGPRSDRDEPPRTHRDSASRTAVTFEQMRVSLPWVGFSRMDVHLVTHSRCTTSPVRRDCGGASAFRAGGEVRA